MDALLRSLMAASYWSFASFKMFAAFSFAFFKISSFWSESFCSRDSSFLRRSERMTLSFFSRSASLWARRLSCSRDPRRFSRDIFSSPIRFFASSVISFGRPRRRLMEKAFDLPGRPIMRRKVGERVLSSNSMQAFCTFSVVRA